MDQLTQFAVGRHRQRLAHAEAQRPAQRLLALARATCCAHPTASPRPGRCLEPATARPAKTPAGLLLTGLGSNAISDLKEEANGHDH
jgi:hypothetical protein